jgi:hypothetical protein
MIEKALYKRLGGIDTSRGSDGMSGGISGGGSYPAAVVTAEAEAVAVAAQFRLHFSDS